MKLLFVFLATAGCATAVSSGNENGDAGSPPKKDAGTATDASKQPTDDAGQPPTDDAGTTTTDDAGLVVDDSTCATATTKAGCQQCCIKLHTTGFGVYTQALDSCLCTSPAACATECATETCANKPTTSGDACETCIDAALVQGTGACYDAVASACQGDVDCTDMFGTCIPPCQSK